MTQEIEIRREAITSSAAERLILALNAELSALYPEPGANHFRLDAAEVAPGRGAFLVAYQNGRPLACGAIRLLSPETAEVNACASRFERARREFVLYDPQW
jgi:putative acetyltransferase